MYFVIPSPIYETTSAKTIVIATTKANAEFMFFIVDGKSRLIISNPRFVQSDEIMLNAIKNTNKLTELINTCTICYMTT